MLKQSLSESIQLDSYYRLFFFLVSPWLPTMSWYNLIISLFSHFSYLDMYSMISFDINVPFNSDWWPRSAPVHEKHPSCSFFSLFFSLQCHCFFVYIYCCNVCPLIGFLCILCPPSLVSISLAYPLDPRVNQCCLVFNYHIPSNLIHLSLPSVTLILFPLLFCLTSIFPICAFFWFPHLYLFCYIMYYPPLALLDF